MHNRRRANVILLSVFILFVVATIVKFSHRDSFLAGLLAFTAEAALVGGIADWFAVTALFKKPLGFSWHTAIIPNNREKIIEKISDMVSDELLSLESIRIKLSDIDVAEALLGKLTDIMNLDVLKEQVQDLVTENMEHLDKEKISKSIDNLIKENLKKENISSEIKNILVKAFEEGKNNELLQMLFNKALQIASKTSTREQIYRILKEQEKYNQETSGAGTFFVKTLLNVSRNSKYTNLVTISQLLQQELIETLELVRNPNHPVYKKLLDASENLLEKLNEEDSLVATLQTWKNGIIERIDLLEILESFISSIIESHFYRDEAAVFIAGHLDSYINDLKHDSEMRHWINIKLKEILEKIIRNEHYLIGEIARETLESFTNERLNQFIEEKVGEDLQWIRINGSIVGASAGLLIYLVTNLLYGPYVVPLIHRLFG